MRDEPLKAKPEPIRTSWKQRIARMLPAVVAEHVREFRALAGPERRAYTQVLIRRLFVSDRSFPNAAAGAPRVLFVCYGNIIRSALAESLYRHHAAALSMPAVDVSSAGVRAKPGREADARAITAGRALGVDLSSHQAQPLTQSLVEEASVIFVMDRLNEAQLLARFPDARKKLRRLGALAKENGSDIIADPYVLDAAAVAAAAERIDRATATLARTLSASSRA